MNRERISLAGPWAFWPDLQHRTESRAFQGAAALSRTLGPPRTIPVPSSWQSHFADLRAWSGTAWYHRGFTVPPSWSGRRLRLRFGAVDYFATVWVNGHPLGEHEGGYTPFDLDMSEAVRWDGTNEICVRVTDRGGSWLDYLDPDAGQPEASLFPLPSVRRHEPNEQRFPLSEIPHGKQSWYGPMGGIWQDVVIESSASRFIDHALVRGDPHSGRTTIRTELGSPATDGQLIGYRIQDPTGRLWTSEPHEVPSGSLVDETTIEVGAPRLWDVDDPQLYRVSVNLDDDAERDTWTDSFGYRSVRAEDGRIFLNDRPLFVIGALDQNYYHPSRSVPDRATVFREDVLRAKAIGLNLLRCHIKVPDPRYLHWADRLGMLVWAEIPNWLFLTQASQERAVATFAAMVRRDYNRPSVVIRSLLNQSWGADLVGEESHRRWLRETVTWAKSLDPSRLLVDNSPCLPSFHLRSDLNDYHHYWTLPDERSEMSGWLDRWSSDPGFSFSPHGDADRTGTEPMILSEFGAWALPDPADLHDADGEDPWWFASGAGWAQGMVRPDGVRERFQEWGLSEVFGSWQGFLGTNRDHQYESLKAQLEEVRRRPAMAGYVITQFADTQWEANGLFDEPRNPKTAPERLRALNADDVVIAHLARHRIVSGETLRADVYVSHYSKADLTPCSVRWSMPEFGAGGSLEGGLRQGEVAALGRIEVPVEQLDRPIEAHLRLALHDRAGEVRHESAWSVPVFARPSPIRDIAVRAVGDLRLRLEREGWSTAALDEAQVAIEACWSDELRRFIEAGGRAVLLAGSTASLPAGAPVQVRARTGTIWQGHWAQGMGWVRPELIRGLPLGARVSVGWTGLTPEHVIFGYGPAERSDVYAGSYLGWLRGHVATIAAFGLGKGACVMCTFPLTTAVGYDPLATELLSRLVRLAAAPGLRPQTRLD